MVEEKRQPEERRQDNRRANVDEKLQSLRSYRKAHGLCMRCGEKWHQGHKCAPALQLHALQEVWEMCQHVFAEEEISDQDAEPIVDQAFLLMSADASSPSIHPRTL